MHGISAIHPRNFHHPQPNRLPSQIHESFLPHALKFDRDLDIKGGDDSYCPVLFEMHVADKRREPATIVHKFTGFGASPRQRDCSLDEERPWSWRHFFPPLATLQDEGTLTSRVVFCHAKIALLPQAIPAGAELQILLDIDTPQYVASSEGLHCSTSFFDNGAFLDRREKPVSVDHDEYSRCRIAFSSQFWADSISVWQKALRHPNPEKRVEAETDIREALARLSAVQEVCYRSSHTGESQLLLLMCWKFEFVKDHGSTTWQNVNIGGDHLKATAKNDVKEELLLNSLVDQVTSGYSHSLVPATNDFDHSGFELRDLANVAIPNLTPSLDQTEVGAEAFPANEIDFNNESIQISIDSSLPIEAYADTTHGFEDYTRAPSITIGDWASHYPNVFDQSQYDPNTFEQVGLSHGKEEGLLGSQHFSLSPIAHMRHDPGNAQHT